MNPRVRDQLDFAKEFLAANIAFVISNILVDTSNMLFQAAFILQYGSALSTFQPQLNNMAPFPMSQ